MYMGRKFSEGRKYPEGLIGSGLKEHLGCSINEGHPYTIYCRKPVFLPYEEIMAK
jgi:hypothetical protein